MVGITQTMHRIALALVFMSLLFVQIHTVKSEEHFLLEMEVDKSIVYAGDKIVFTLTLVNVGVEDATLSYGPPLFDLTCCAAKGCYRWSVGKYFVFIVLELKLQPGENHTETLEWDLYEYKGGTYYPTVPDKYNLTGMCFHAGAITPSPLVITVIYNSDLNKDLKVDIQDLTVVAIAYGARIGEEKWNAPADLDRNEWINIVDIALVAVDYGKAV